MTPAERAAAIAAQARQREAAIKARNREQMPETVRHLDEFVRVFGKLQAGRVWEGGRTVEWGQLDQPWWSK